MYIVDRAKKALCGIESDDYMISNPVIALFRQRKETEHMPLPIKGKSVLQTPAPFHIPG